MILALLKSRVILRLLAIYQQTLFESKKLVTSVRSGQRGGPGRKSARENSRASDSDREQARLRNHQHWAGAFDGIHGMHR